MASSVDERLLLIALLENLVGTWQDTQGSKYELSLDSPPRALTVRTVKRNRPARTTKGLIQLRLGEPSFYYVCWGNNYVLDGALLKMPAVTLTWNRIDGSGTPFLWTREYEPSSALGAQFPGDVNMVSEPEIPASADWPSSAPDAPFSEEPNTVVKQNMSASSYWSSNVPDAQFSESGQGEPPSSNWPSSTPDVQFSVEPNMGLRQDMPLSEQWPSSELEIDFPQGLNAAMAEVISSSSYWPSSAPDTQLPQSTMAQFLSSRSHWPSSAPDTQLPQGTMAPVLSSSSHWPSSAPDTQEPLGTMAQVVSSSSHWPSSALDTQLPPGSDGVSELGMASVSQWLSPEAPNDAYYPWVECMDMTHNMPYYYNTVTGESSWQLP